MNDRNNRSTILGAGRDIDEHKLQYSADIFNRESSWNYPFVPQTASLYERSHKESDCLKEYAVYCLKKR